MDVCAGNGGHTLITAPFARQLGLVDELGRPRWQTRVQRVQVRGVVAGASESVPVMTLSYEIAGELLCRLSHWQGDLSDGLKHTYGLTPTHEDGSQDSHAPNSGPWVVLNCARHASKIQHVPQGLVADNGELCQACSWESAGDLNHSKVQEGEYEVRACSAAAVL